MRQSFLPFPLLYLAVLLLAACTLDTEYFKDYKDVNLIGNRPLSLTGVYPDGSHWWETGTDPDQDPSTDNDPLMGFYEVTSVPGPSDSTVPPSTPVYRLEIKNLIPNGDFNAPLDPALWSESSPRPLPLQIRNGEYTPSPQVSAQDYFRPVTEGNPALWINVGDSDTAALNLSSISDALASVYGEALEGQYLIRFSFRAYNSLQFRLGSLWDGVSSQTPEITVNMNDFGQPGPDASLPKVGIIPSGNNPFPFQITAGQNFTLNFDGRINPPQNIVMDDLRLVYGETTDASRSLWLELKIPDLEDAVLKLLPGNLYKLTLWVKNELPEAVTPLTPNAYPAKALSIRLDYLDSELTLRNAATKVFPASASWDSWQKLEIDFQSENTLQFPGEYDPLTNGNQPVMKILISPADQTNINTIDAGRLLIAAPSLVFREKK